MQKKLPGGGIISYNTIYGSQMWLYNRNWDAALGKEDY